MIKNKKKIYFFTSTTVLIILIVIGIFIKMNNVTADVFSTRELEVNTSAYKDISDKVMESVKDSGVYLLNTGEENVTYLILDGTHMSLKNEAPYFSDVKIENKEKSIMIYFNEELKIYPDGEYPEHRLIYRITKTKDNEFIRVFKNGEETHIDSVILT
ncbi:MAG: hypothetical protein ABF685_28620 [Clostridium saccharoperbutylacetonicum]